MIVVWIGDWQDHRWSLGFPRKVLGYYCHWQTEVEMEAGKQELLTVWGCRSLWDGQQAVRCVRQEAAGVTQEGAVSSVKHRNTQQYPGWSTHWGWQSGDGWLSENQRVPVVQAECRMEEKKSKPGPSNLQQGDILANSLVNHGHENRYGKGRMFLIKNPRRVSLQWQLVNVGYWTPKPSPYIYYQAELLE